MRYLISILLLACAVQAGPNLIRAERNYEYALKIVEIAERKSKDSVRHRLLVRAAPVLRQARLWYGIAVRAGEETEGIDAKLQTLDERIAQGRREFIAPTDRTAHPVVPNTGTVVIVVAEPGSTGAGATVAGGDRNAKRMERRQELKDWRVQRTLLRQGTRAINLQRAALLHRQASRRAQLLGPKNIGRVEKRAALDHWRMARIEERVSK
jgi:hypothetical protein